MATALIEAPRLEEVQQMEEERELAAAQEQVLGALTVGDYGSDENGVDGSDEGDCYDSVCAICDNGGHVLLCDGKCMRSFHPTVEDGRYSGCLSLRITDAELQALKDVAFYCENCKYKKHQCFACGELGSSDESSSPEVLRCLNGACGYFYHPHCVAKLLHPGNCAAAEELKQRISAGEQFTCPAHKCHDCKEVEVRSIKELQFAVCRRCPRAYHRKCLPREITFADDVNMERGILQRAWEEDLIPNRILIYCLDHEIEPDTLMPPRDHLKFPEFNTRKNLLEEISLALEDNAGHKISDKPPKRVDLYCSSDKGDRSKKRMGKLFMQAPSKKQKVAIGGNPLGKLKHSKTCARNISLCDNLYSTDAATRRRISGLMKDASSSVTLSQVKERHASSTYLQAMYPIENITLGKVEGSVQALHAALKILDEGGRVQDAKAVCPDALLLQVLRWKGKLKVYLAPFLHGMRYTSFGRHFTKIDKLKEIVDILHWYVQDGDMLVDFCCGSNDFSCLMKKKLDGMGKSCLFKNYDIVQPKNDFNFERRDWMTVKPDELLDGSKLIMGLNPPFGVDAALANKFINKALQFKPKLLILIVPQETRRLDERESPYDLIWKDDRMLVGKSFYLPGSVDVNDNQIEDWNVNTPLLSLWSSPNWTSKHRSIAEQHGHPGGTPKNCSLEESHSAVCVPNSDPNKAFVKQGVVVDADPPEQIKRVTIIQQEGLPLDVNSSEGGTKSAPVKSHSELKPKEFSRKGNMKRSLVHSQRGDFQQQLNQMNSSMHPRYSHISYYNENQGLDDLVSKYSLKSGEGLVRKYNLNSEEDCQNMSSRQAYGPTDQWMSGRAYDFGHRSSYIGEINEDHHRDATFHSHLNLREPNSWSHPELTSSYGQRDTFAVQQHGPRVDEFHHATMNEVYTRTVSVQTRSAIYQPPPAFLGGFVPRVYHSYSQHNSWGWLNE